MTNVCKKSIDRALEIYKPEARFLLAARLDENLAEGRFLVQKNFYAVGEVNHLTDVDIQICLNQLSYVALYEFIQGGENEMLQGLDFDDLQREGMLIIESRKRFRRMIPIGKEINGKLFLKDYRKFGENLFCKAEFSFDNRSCFGNLEMVVANKINTTS